MFEITMPNDIVLKLQKLGSDMQDKINQLLRNEANSVISQIINITPNDTGKTRSSWKLKLIKNGFVITNNLSTKYKDKTGNKAFIINYNKNTKNYLFLTTFWQNKREQVQQKIKNEIERILKGA